MTPCVHHWVLPPLGVVVIATCKFCGDTKEFNNAPEFRYTVGGKSRGKTGLGNWQSS